MKGMTHAVHAMQSYAFNAATELTPHHLSKDVKILAAIEQAWDGTEVGRDLIAAAIVALGPVFRQATRRPSA